MKSLQNVRIEIEGPTTPPRAGLADAPLTAELRVFFDSLTAQPLPDRMLELAQALEDAFGRGELYAADRRRSS